MFGVYAHVRAHMHEDLHPCILLTYAFFVLQNLSSFCKEGKMAVINSSNQMTSQVLEKTNSGSLDSLQSTNKWVEQS